MPKGQYPRKPKPEAAPMPQADNPTAWGRNMNSAATTATQAGQYLPPAEPTGGVVIGDTVHQPLAEKTFVEPDSKPVPAAPHDAPLNDPIAALALEASRMGAELGAVVVLSHRRDVGELRGHVTWPSGKTHRVTVAVPASPSWVEMNAAVAEVRAIASENYHQLHRPEPATFDTWLDEDAIAVPANDRVSQMVREFFAGLVPIDHSVSWLPSDDGKALSVLLTTIHGTSQLVADAGTWSETDVMAALNAMRVDLGV